MGLFGKLFAKKQTPSLLQDLQTASDWVAAALESSGYRADFSLESLREIDRFFDEQRGPGGLLEERRGQRLFALGAYLGEVLLRAYGGAWQTDDGDPRGELNVAVRLSYGGVLWPVQRIVKRYQNGPEDGIYIYGLFAAPEEDYHE